VISGRRFYPSRAMDVSKFPLEKVFHFVAGIIPGFVALLIYELASPGSFGWFFTLGFLGYRTKLSLIVLVAFVVGNSMTTFLGSCLGMLGAVVGTIAAQQPYKQPPSYETAPWRDPKWRTVLKSYLGPQAPNDTQLLSEKVIEQLTKAIDLRPSVERRAALAKLNFEVIDTKIDDGHWADWYDHYHEVIVLGHDKKELDWYVRTGLNVNLEAAAVYVLLSALVVPRVRHWWILFPACLWILILLAESYYAAKQFTNKWSTLSAQIRYLTAQEPLKSSPSGS